MPRGVNKELENAKALLNKRNKAIRFADKSPAGWTAVEEYESDEFADDSEDQKKLRSAERRALSNWLRAREQNGTSGQNRFKSQFPQEASHAAGSPYPSASQPFRPAGNNFLSSPFVNSHFGTDNHSLPTNVSPVVSSGIGQIHHFAQTTVTCTETEPCQVPPPLPSTSSEAALNRLGCR